MSALLPPEPRPMEFCSFSGHFMYVDSGHARTFVEVAKLASPMTTVPMSGCLTFQYQRNEGGGNLFSVYTRDRLGQYQELWRAGSEDQEEWGEALGEWIPVQVDLKAPYSVQVRTMELSLVNKRSSFGATLLDRSASLRSGENLQALIWCWICSEKNVLLEKSLKT